MKTTSDEEKIKSLDDLFIHVGRYKRCQDMKELFRFIRRFRNIAPYNAALIHVQKPGSVFVATAREWGEEFGRQIKIGARPLVILRTFGPIEFVFELEDTTGEAPLPEEIFDPFHTGGSISNSLYHRLIHNLARDGIRYTEVDHGSHSAGFICKNSEEPRFQNIKRRPSVVLYVLGVNGNLSLEAKFATIAHELGHLYCGHLGSPHPNWWPNRTNLAYNAREFEAESVAWLVCERCGIHCPSDEYLSYFLDNNDEVPDISLESVLKAAGLIESMLDRSLSLRKEVIVR